ncbi:hypothetical protein BDW02DRAFT_565923 [Decorospora gaudefroyi]|uniref:Uncharacterized protein n=1 Tax=Decorospora gaudefroyi TaxID=184978 RepID=A0A6A5KKJ0_9PLEO|nr:hypothetical protein BDW02DRAFT_565923 [Decorospora gaudefroyi]
MKRLHNIETKLTPNSTSLPSPSTPTSAPPAHNVHNNNQPTPKYPIRKPTMRLFPHTQSPLPTVEIVTAHSCSFNSERAMGMDKLAQMTFIRRLKDEIIDCAPLIDDDAGKNAIMYRVVTARKEGGLAGGSPVAAFSEGVMHVAKLFAVDASGTVETAGWTLFEQSEEREYVVDAVEALWEKVMSRVGEMTDGLEIGGIVKGGMEKRLGVLDGAHSYL